MRTPTDRPRRGGWRRIALLLMAAAALFFGGLVAWMGLSARTAVAGEPDLMIIFGCKVREDGPSAMLQDRLDTALDYLADAPDMTVVVTGGQGEDESISEAQGMAEYLRAQGFEGAILVEDRSHSTWQNVTCTLALLEREGLNPQDGVVLVSSGFHLARVRMLWERAAGDGPVSTLAAPVSHFPSAVWMFVREPLALVKSFLVDR